MTAIQHTRKASLSGARRVDAGASAADRVRRPEDLLDSARAHALEVRLGHRSLFGTWTRFKRERVGASPIEISPPESITDGVARLRLAVEAPGATHLEICFEAHPDERFVGFGERFNGVDQRGQKLEVWAEEGAIGLGEGLSRLLTRLGASFNPFPKGKTTAYKPFPWFISSRGYAVFLDTTAPVFFDVAASDPGVVACEVAAREVEVLVFVDADPKTLVQRFVAYTGKPRGVPDWALGPWNDALHGEDEARRVAALLRREGIPSSVLWMEDWHNGKWSFFGDTRLGWFNINPVLRGRRPRAVPRLRGARERPASERLQGSRLCLSLRRARRPPPTPRSRSADICYAGRMTVRSRSRSSRRGTGRSI